MVKLAEETLVAVGRMTVAATDLEHVLFDEITVRLLRCRDALHERILVPIEG